VPKPELKIALIETWRFQCCGGIVYIVGYCRTICNLIYSSASCGRVWLFFPMELADKIPFYYFFGTNIKDEEIPSIYHSIQSYLTGH
jgi:hypothetical protein